MVGGANLLLQSNTIPARDTQRAQTNFVHKRTQGSHRDGDRTVFEHLSCGGRGQQWTATRTGALGAADLGMAYSLLEEVAINPTIELPELTQDWEIDSWRESSERSKEKGAVIPQETDPVLSMSVQESPLEA